MNKDDEISVFQCSQLCTINVYFNIYLTLPYWKMYGNNWAESLCVVDTGKCVVEAVH